MPNVVGFDYYSVEGGFEKQERLRAHARAIHQLVARTARNIIEIGSRLQQVHELIGKELFSMWLEAELQLSAGQAYAFMRVAEKFGELEAAGNIQPSALVLLSRGTIPEAAVD